MFNAQKSSGLHMSILGKSNADKSSFNQRVTYQSISVVYESPGTARNTELNEIVNRSCNFLIES